MSANLITDADRAIRLARAIASDISLYNEEKVKTAVEKDTFFDLLAHEFEEGRALYSSRVSPALDAQSYHYWCAIINMVLLPRGHLKSKIW